MLHKLGASQGHNYMGSGGYRQIQAPKPEIIQNAPLLG